MDQYGLEPDHNDTAYLEEGELMTTTRFEIMSYLGPEPGQADEDGAF